MAGWEEKLTKRIKENKEGTFILSRGYENIGTQDHYIQGELKARDSIKIVKEFGSIEYIYTLWDTPIVHAIITPMRKYIVLRDGNWKTKETQERMNVMLKKLNTCHIAVYERTRNFHSDI